LKEPLSLESVPNVGRVYYNWASSLKQAGLMEEAKERFERVIELSSPERKDFIGGAHLGCIHQNLGNKEKARQHFEECLKSIPNHCKAKEYLEVANNER